MEPLQILRQLPLFADVPEPLLEAIARGASWRPVAAGEVVVEAGDPGDALYVINDGTVEILVRTADGIAPTRVATLGPGECFGEMALLTGEPRSATVRALTDTTLLRVASEDFSRLVADVSVYQRLVTLLCSRLRRTDVQLEEAQWAQMALSRHLQGAHAHGDTEIHGSTPASRALRDAIEAAAAASGPVLLEGEAGSGKSLAASLIIAKSARADGPVISIDCSAAGVDAASEIFGHEAGTLPGARARHLGALELCDNGTVIIAEPHRLPTMVQERLVGALERGVFQRIGGDEELPLNARVIVTRRMEPSAAVPAVDPGIEALFSGGHIRVPPLRDRRRDIPQLAEALIERHARDLRRPKPELDPGAIERLLSYEWPGNVEELDSVLRRAVALFADDRIEADHILIHLPSISEEGRVDLFRIPFVAKFVGSRWYPLALQLPTAAVLALIVFECFFGPQTGENIALTLTWPIWWAALPLSFLFLGRIWCTICPFSLLSSVVQRIGCLNLPVPAFFRKTEIWPMTALFVFLTWADEYWHYPDKPMWTGAVLGSVLAGTLLFSFLFERRVWCRYLCPLGGVNGVYSTAALVELRANTDVCAYHCRAHECVSKEPGRACPMLERPLAMDTNRNCNLCMNCVKHCPHGAIHLFLRRPGAEIWQIRTPMLSAGVLCLLLTGTMLTHGLCKYVESQGKHLIDVPPATWLGFTAPAQEGAAWTATYLALLLLSVLAGCIASAVSSSRERKPWSSNLA
ncbi:MAG TPA: sigma 54-interacting transcriptional regulator, partial [Armatimonadota bacterium]|nr:sigma 54-interacting transcriptional regulator [Armatimonadota bacterium]